MGHLASWLLRSIQNEFLMARTRWMALITACVFSFMAQAACGAPAPPKRQTRFLAQDQELLIQKKADKWIAPPVTVMHDGKLITVRRCFLCNKGDSFTEISGQEDFLKKPGPKGIFYTGFGIGDRTGFTPHYYRLEKKGRKRFLILSGYKPGEEIRFGYELDGKVLRLTGGEQLGSSEVGLIDFTGVYKRSGSPSQKKRD
jgi:hypothetical protein